MTADPRFPIGKFVRSDSLSAEQRTAAIQTIADAPAKLRGALEGLNRSQLDTPYRPGGWSVRQVVHHLADSHMNAFTRFKLGLTEDTPTIKPYDEAKWAELEDGKSELVDESIQLLTALHARWKLLLDSMKPSDFSRKINHPEWKEPMSLDTLLALYEWHSRHHVAHITELRKREGWVGS
jgi:uncharacterized damage-inducible protein DinB